MPYSSPNGLIAMSVILAVLTNACVAARFVSRRRNNVKLGADDWLILAALLVGTGLAGMEIYGAASSALGVPLGATIEDETAATGRVQISKHLEFAYIELGVLGAGLVKLSVSFLLRRIFVVKSFRMVMNVWIVIIILWTLAFVLVVLFQCGSHITAGFSPTGYLQYCSIAIPSGWAWVGSDVATDFIMIVLPLPVIWRLNMSTSRKLLVASNFMIGLLSVGAGIGKLYIYVEATLGLYTEDAITTLTGFSVWNFVEIEVGIIAACGPALRTAAVMFYTNPSVTRLVISMKRSVGSLSRITTSGSSSRKPP